MRLFFVVRYGPHLLCTLASNKLLRSLCSRSVRFLASSCTGQGKTVSFWLYKNGSPAFEYLRNTQRTSQISEYFNLWSKSLFASCSILMLKSSISKRVSLYSLAKRKFVLDNGELPEYLHTLITEVSYMPLHWRIQSIRCFSWLKLLNTDATCAPRT